MTADARRRFLPLAVLFLLGSAAFAGAYAQAPLYYSNQNQYFLHGLAHAGVGLLSEDWLASTRDPTPVFSALVALTARFLHPALFYVYYALLMGVYAAALLGIFAFVAGERSGHRWPVFVSLFFLAHAALVRWASYRLLGLDYPWYLQTGVAGQYVLGPVFQPSTFGVLLVAAVYLFVSQRPLAAGGCVALAANVHPTYLMAGGLLVAAFLLVLLWEGRPRLALGVGAGTLALVVPVLLFTYLAFRPTSTTQFHSAQDILARIRIPHHTQPRLWCDPIAIGQICWVAVAVALAPAGRLRRVLAISSLLSLGLTLVQVLIKSDTLALLFPWRLFAVLVPLATTILLTRLATLPLSWLDRAPARAVSALVVVVLVAGGAWIMATGRGFHSAREEDGLLDYVRRSRQRGDVYLIPVVIPNLAKQTHGSLSGDFKPLPDKRRDPRLIPIGFQGFRLATGTPIWIDFKSVPYLDVEVLEWWKRLAFAQVMQDQLEAAPNQAVGQLRRNGITCAVVRASVHLHHPALKEVYADEYFRVYRLLPLRGRVPQRP